MKSKLFQNSFIAGTLSIVLSLTSPAQAEVIPAEIPTVDLNAPIAKDKPVKIYIMSGQSNMLGFGLVEGARPLYSRVFLSADPSTVEGGLGPIKGTAMLKMGIYQDPGKDAATGGVVSGSKKAIRLGTTAETVPSGTVEAYLEVPIGGLFSINVGLDESSYAVATVDGKEVYRKEKGGDALITPVKLKKNTRHKISINYEQGGSAAIWLEKTDLQGMGDLRWTIENLGKFKSLLNTKGEWVARPDVIHTDAYMGKGKSEPLSAPACGKAIGPELGFGWVMGELHDEPVIVMKADIGNRSLGWDILPPGSESYTHDGKNYPGYKEMLDDDGNVVKWDGESWYAGKQYDDYTAAVHKVLNEFGEKFPEYKDQGYEVAGFVWWQGHKDGPNPGHNKMYERNMVNLIKAWRKEFKAPEADWTIATVAFDGERMPEHYQQIVQAQLNVADPERHPELKGNVKTIDARPFWRPAGMSPKNQNYHYNHNAETYMLVGDALGRAMVELKGGKVEYPSGEMDTSFDTLPDLPYLGVSDLKSMQSALKPIILQGVVPDFVRGAESLPKHIQGGMKLSKLLANQTPKGDEEEIGYKLTSQLDRMISYYQLAGVDTYSWKATDPDKLNLEWSYFSFDPKEPASTKGSLTNYREVKLPQGMGNWFATDFDAAKAGWQKGKAPFGQQKGKLAALRDTCNANHCKCDMTPNTLWEKEVILMRTEMKMPEFDPKKRYRLVVGGAGHAFSGEGYDLYINSKLVSTMDTGYYKSGGAPRGIYLYEDFQKKYSGKPVTLALKGFLRTSHHKTKTAPPSGHINAWVQSVELPSMLQEMAAKNSVK